MKFSLVLATLGRVDEMDRFLDSLVKQTYQDFELIIVDQNDDDRLVPILAPYLNQLSIIHLRSWRGLSRARNVGLQHASGDVVAFPDDDCWYADKVLEQVKDKFTKNPQWDGLTGRSTDENGVDFVKGFSQQQVLLDRFNVWRQAISITIFLRRKLVESVGLFDESLGLGSGTIFGSGEETDYLVRAVNTGFHIYYSPDLIVHHPHPEEIIDDRMLTRTFAYGCGMGRVLSKHHYPLWFKAKALIRPLGGAALYLGKLSKPKAELHLMRCIGRAKGLFSKMQESGR
jgi:glycosyltransferase involved in cell wall biosynthesis